MSEIKKQDYTRQQLEKPMTYLQQLTERNFSGNQSNILIRDFLWLAFDCFAHHKPFLSADERTKIALHSDQLVPALEETFVSIHGSMNRDKLVEAQIYLSGLKFLMNDFQDDQKLTEKFDKLWESDAVQCVVDYVNNAAGTNPEYVDDPQIDLTNVPKTHVWWNFP